MQMQNEALKAELQQLKRMIFGSKHERFVPTDNNPSQLTLGIQADAVAQCNINSAKKIEYTRTTTTVTEKREHPGRTKLPEHLERREIVIEPQQNIEGCKKIGQEVTEELEYEPGKLFVNRFA